MWKDLHSKIIILACCHLFQLCTCAFLLTISGLYHHGSSLFLVLLHVVLKYIFIGQVSQKCVYFGGSLCPAAVKFQVSTD